MCKFKNIFTILKTSRKCHEIVLLFSYSENACYKHCLKTTFLSTLNILLLASVYTLSLCVALIKFLVTIFPV